MAGGSKQDARRHQKPRTTCLLMYVLTAVFHCVFLTQMLHLLIVCRLIHSSLVSLFIAYLFVVGFRGRCHQVLQRSSACEIASCLAAGVHPVIKIKLPQPTYLLEVLIVDSRIEYIGSPLGFGFDSLALRVQSPTPSNAHRYSGVAGLGWFRLITANTIL